MPNSSRSVKRLMTEGVWVAIVVSVTLVAPAAEKPIQFNRDIRGLLFDRCVACHGPDEKQRQADLRLDQEESAKEYAIVPGDSDASELIARITTTDPDLRMPPADSGKSLSPAEIELLTRWVQEGAEWQAHWAFLPPQSPNVPVVDDAAWAQNGIDRFVLARLEAEGLRPSVQASHEMLIRRLSFDLTGLPPTLEDIDAFLADESPGAFERVVDRLLSSPRFGEQLGTQWLQIARYADSNGYQNDFRREQWPWRDWVIEAFNQNMPFDQFLIEQTAGDMLPIAEQSQLVATGFHRNNRTVTEAGSIDEEWRVENTIDRVETTSLAFLGLTLGCARCHDHKYDPITQKEFYQFYGFFNSIDEQGVYTETRGNVPPLIALPTSEDQERLTDFDQRIAASDQGLRDAIAQRVDEMIAGVREKTAEGPKLTPRASISFDGDLKVEQREATHRYKPLHEPGERPVVAELASGQQTFGDSLFGKALVLANADGKSSIHVGLGEAIRPDRETPFSLSLWIRPEDAPQKDGGPGDAAIISRMESEPRSRGWDVLLLPDGTLKLRLIHELPDNAVEVVSQGKLTRRQWSHVVVSYDGSGQAAGISVTVNRQPVDLQIARDTLSGTIAVDQPARLGGHPTTSAFNGAMARFHWFDRALTSDELERLYADDLAGLAETGLGALPEVRQNLLREFVTAQDVALIAQRDALAKLKEEKAAYEKQIATVMILKDRETPRETFLLARGAYDAPDKSEALEPNVPAILPPLPKELPRNRLALAYWMADPEHPLTARIQVNRAWQRMFGRGIVASVDNFGVQADAPSHPELLDWLAVEFVRSGWDVKALYRQIALSATYQQTSDATPAAIAADPDNVRLSRGPRNRLPAELVRDNALAVSGLLAEKIGGPSVKPYQPEGLWEELAGGANEGPYVLSEGEDLYRRSLYTNRKRTVPHTTMSTFDAPSFEVCTVQRAITNTPLQSLALLNDVTYVEASRKLAERMLRDGGDDARSRVRYGFRLATGRLPDEKETSVLEVALTRYLETYRADESAAKELLRHGKSSNAEELDTPVLAAYAVLASVLLNLDETISKQ